MDKYEHINELIKGNIYGEDLIDAMLSRDGIILEEETNGD